ncbi:MAG: pyridoxal phosphate enzyme (YggS family) [Saprospiraceae bacterium]|jgi:pyridoxal phosphate enzyme (YggS family)
MPEKTPLQEVQTNIATYCEEFGRDVDEVKLVAVSKTRSSEAVGEMAAQGQVTFGENYLQEAIDKIIALAENKLEWHFIGHIQSRKAALIARHFQWVHSVDRLKVAQKLNDAVSEGEYLNVLIQVNLQQEQSKSGVQVVDLMPLVEQIENLPNLRARGLMLIPEPQSQFDAQRRVFSSARELLVRAQRIAPEMDQLSMGMTGDMRAAIAEGATMVRIGTALFGAREYK